MKHFGYTEQTCPPGMPPTPDGTSCTCPEGFVFNPKTMACDEKVNNRDKYVFYGSLILAAIFLLKGE